MSTEQTEYAKSKEERHRRKIILPCVIPWEYGSNKFASQKGSGGFGTSRDNTLKIFSTTPLTKNDESVVPLFSATTSDLASQAGGASFGKHRDQVTRVSNTNQDDKIDINRLVPDKHKTSERILKKWSQPNPEAKNNDIGKRRNVVSTSSGGRRFTAEEQVASHAAIPRFHDARNSFAALNSKPGEALVVGLTRNRQATTEIEGMERSEKQQMDSNKYMAWIGGQLTLQSQARTGGFQKPRIVVSTSYYDKLTSEQDPRALRLRRKKKSEEKKEEGREEAKEIGHQPDDHHLHVLDEEKEDGGE